MRIPLKIIPQEIIDAYNLTAIVNNQGWIYMRIKKGLFEAKHAFLDAHVNPPLVVDQCCEVIIINDFLWDNFQGNAHEFRVW